VPEGDRDAQVLMRFVGGDASVLNGLMRGASEIKNVAAVVEQTVGQGRLVLFGTNPCYRWQNHGEFGMLFNAVLHWNDRPAPAATVPPASPAPPVTVAGHETGYAGPPAVTGGPAERARRHRQ
jgi:hypothetical protein